MNELDVMEFIKKRMIDMYKQDELKLTLIEGLDYHFQVNTWAVLCFFNIVKKNHSNTLDCFDNCSFQPIPYISSLEADNAGEVFYTLNSTQCQAICAYIQTMPPELLLKHFVRFDLGGLRIPRKVIMGYVNLLARTHIGRDSTCDTPTEAYTLVKHCSTLLDDKANLDLIFFKAFNYSYLQETCLCSVALEWQRELLSYEKLTEQQLSELLFLDNEQHQEYYVSQYTKEHDKEVKAYIKEAQKNLDLKGIFKPYGVACYFQPVVNTNLAQLNGTLSKLFELCFLGASYNYELKDSTASHQELNLNGQSFIQDFHSRTRALAQQFEEAYIKGEQQVSSLPELIAIQEQTIAVIEELKELPYENAISLAEIKDTPLYNLKRKFLLQNKPSNTRPNSYQDNNFNTIPFKFYLYDLFKDLHSLLTKAHSQGAFPCEKLEFFLGRVQNLMDTLPLSIFYQVATLTYNYDTGKDSDLIESINKRQKEMFEQYALPFNDMNLSPVTLQEPLKWCYNYNCLLVDLLKLHLLQQEVYNYQAQDLGLKDYQMFTARAALTIEQILVIQDRYQERTQIHLAPIVWVLERIKPLLADNEQAQLKQESALYHQQCIVGSKWLLKVTAKIKELIVTLLQPATGSDDSYRAWCHALTEAQGLLLLEQDALLRQQDATFYTKALASLFETLEHKLNFMRNYLSSITYHVSVYQYPELLSKLIQVAPRTIFKHGSLHEAIIEIHANLQFYKNYQNTELLTYAPLSNHMVFYSLKAVAILIKIYIEDLFRSTVMLSCTSLFMNNKQHNKRFISDILPEVVSLIKTCSTVAPKYDKLFRDLDESLEKCQTYLDDLSEPLFDSAEYLHSCEILFDLATNAEQTFERVTSESLIMRFSQIGTNFSSFYNLPFLKILMKMLQINPIALYNFNLLKELDHEQILPTRGITDSKTYKDALRHSASFHQETFCLSELYNGAFLWFDEFAKKLFNGDNEDLIYHVDSASITLEHQFVSFAHQVNNSISNAIAKKATKRVKKQKQNGRNKKRK